MKKIFKQSFSLILALMMVLSLVPVMPLAASAEDFTPGQTWTVESAYTNSLRCSFTPADDDFIYEADETINWKAYLESAVAVNAGINVRATLSVNGQKLVKEQTGLSVAKGGTLLLGTAGGFPEIVDGGYYGNFTLTLQVYHGTKLAATGVLNFTRNEPAPVETEPVETTPAKVEYKAKWTYKTGYEFINGAFNTAEEDFIFAGTPYDWTVTINSDKSTGARIDATLETQDGQVLTASKELTIPVGEFQLFDYTAFPQLTNELIGNFKLTTTITVKLNGVETPVAQLEAVFGRSAAYVEPTPEEPEVPATPTKPGDVVWTYGKSSDAVSYDWLQGAVSTSNTTGIYKGWDAYDWKITLSPTKASATVTVEANVVDHTGATIGTVTKDVEVGMAPSVTTILTPGELGLNNKTLGDFRVTAVIKYNGEAVAQVQAVFGRRIGDAGYTAVEHLSTYEWINGSFSAADEDMTYVGIQKYDWRATIAPTKSAATVDVAVTVVNAQGETVATLNKTGVACAKGATTALVTAGEIAELTADLYGKFAITTVASMGGKAYAGIYGVIEHVEGEFVADTAAPEFAPANWENCGLPTAVTVTNNGEMNKPIEVKISITDAQGNVLASMNKTATVGAGATGTLVTTNQLRNFITERGATYYVVIEGRWTNGYDEYTINESLSYTWTEHDEAKAEVVPGYAATCTETGLTDGVYCHGCEGTIVEQEEIPVDPEAHNYVDGTCACGATQDLTDASLKFYRAKETNPYGNFKLTGEIIAYLTARKQATYDDYYVVFTYTYLDNVVTFKAAPSSSSDANYALFDCPVPAALMTTGIEATVYGVKGDKEYRGETIVFTARECVDAKLDMWINNYDKNAQVAKLFDTLVNMLAYGAQAQTRFGINTDNLATDGLPENYAAKIKTDVLTLKTHSNPSESGQKATLYSMSLMLKEKINMYGNFKVKSGFTKIEDYKVVIVHTKADGSTVTHEITDVELKTGNYVYFEFDKVAPAQMRDELQITLYQNGEAVSATYIRSGETIVASLAAALQPLGNAAMQLADCAKAAFG